MFQNFLNTILNQVTIEDFNVERARELDVVFVSVSGDFSKEWCDKIAEKYSLPPPCLWFLDSLICEIGTLCVSTGYNLWHV